MQAYMKSGLPYRGSRCHEYARSCALKPPSDHRRPFSGWPATVRALWRPAEYREERYAATALTGAVQRAATADSRAAPALPEK